MARSFMCRMWPIAITSILTLMAGAFNEPSPIIA
jgi:hypothetical protein